MHVSSLNLITEIIFYAFATMASICAMLVTLSKNPVHAVLCLVFTFFNTAVTWIILQASFLGLVLVLVYIGAVMTLFLFVVMMLNLSHIDQQKGVINFWPIALLLNLTIFLALLFVFIFKYPHTIHWLVPQHFDVNDSNIKTLGEQMYTHYLLPFELVGVLLLVGMISAIALTKNKNTKQRYQQQIARQIQTQAKDRLSLIADKEIKNK